MSVESLSEVILEIKKILESNYCKSEEFRNELISILKEQNSNLSIIVDEILKCHIFVTLEK